MEIPKNLKKMCQDADEHGKGNGQETVSAMHWYDQVVHLNYRMNKDTVVLRNEMING